MLTDAQTADITAYVNSYRAKNQAPPLQWDASICAVSQNWSNHLLSSHTVQHSGISAYGENIAFFQGYGTDPVTLIKKSVDAWYAEIALYDFSKPGFSETTGHFTCLVWVASTKFCIAIALDSMSGEAYIVMNTSPPGNYIGQFEQNVLPLLGTTPMSTVPTVLIPPQLQTHKRILFKQLYNIVHAINTNQPKAVIIGIINNIIHQVDAYPTF